MSNFYKPIKRWYLDPDIEEWKKGKFIACGQMADGHLAYSRLDEDDNEIEGEETSYIQCRSGGMLCMYHI